jgi:hypothetical protein
LEKSEREFEIDTRRKRIEREKEVWRRCPSFSAVRRQRKRIESCSFARSET